MTPLSIFVIATILLSVVRFVQSARDDNPYQGGSASGFAVGVTLTYLAACFVAGAWL